MNHVKSTTLFYEYVSNVTDFFSKLNFNSKNRLKLYPFNPYYLHSYVNAIKISFNKFNTRNKRDNFTS